MMKNWIYILLILLPFTILGQMNNAGSYRTAAYHSTLAEPDYTYLVSWYSFDEASGDAIDSHSTGDDGTVTGATYGATGKINDAYDFEYGDAGDYVTITGFIPGAGNVGVMGWVNVESLPGNSMMGGGSGALYWQLNANGTMYIAEQDDNVSQNSTITVPTGVLTFVAFSYNNAANTVTFWVNDTKEVVTFNDANIPAATTTIGARLVSDYSFDGIMDEWSMWSNTLSDAKVAYYYNEGNGRGY